MSTAPAARKRTSKPAGKPTARAPGTPGVRERAAIASREGILQAAIKVFAKHGYDGGSVEKISKAAKSYDRMIYYYFGSKEGLYIAALEAIYRRFNDAEGQLVLDLAKPEQSLREVIGFVVRYYREHPEFVTLLNTENLHRGRHIAKFTGAREYSSPVIDTIARLLANGRASGLWREGPQARDIYLMIAAMGYFYQSNRYTLSAFLGEDLQTAEAVAHWEDFATDSVLRTLGGAVPASNSRRGNKHG